MGKQRQRRFCGQCTQCLVKADCGKCKFCLNKKTLKKKCELRRCRVYEKVPAATSNVQNCEVKWIFTLQLSNKLIEACYNQEYGTENRISGTIYDNATIYRDHEKVTIELEDSSNIVYTRTTAGKPHHHSLVDITFNDESYTTTNPIIGKPKQIETINDLSHSDLCHPSNNTKNEENEFFSDNLEEQLTETILVNFTNEKTRQFEVKLERCDSVTSNDVVNTEDNISKQTNVLRRKRKLLTPMMYKKEYCSNNEEESNDESLNISTYSEKKICQKVNVKCEPDTMETLEFSGHTEAGELPETNEENDETDEYTVSSEDECETDIDDWKKSVKKPSRKTVFQCCCGFKSSSRDSLTEHKRICKSGQSTYSIKIRCPVCSVFYKYSKTGIIRHIRINHKEKDDQLNLQEKIKKNMIDCAEVKDEMMCEFCNKNFSKASYPLHIQWDHSDQNLKKTQDSLADYFSSVMTVNELNSKYTKMKCSSMTVAEEDSSADDLQHGRNIYIIKIKCPVCDIMFQFNEEGVLKHIEECHSDVDNKLELITEMKQNMIDTTNFQEDHLSCEFCGTFCTKAFLPLHIQWDHSENHFERSQDILATYFKTVMSIEELQCESIIKDFDMAIIEQKNTRMNLRTSCDYCGKMIDNKKLPKHHKICYKNQKTNVLSQDYQCKCGFRSPEISLVMEHKALCYKENAFYKIRVPCPVCKCLYKYSKEGIIRHLKDHHKDVPNQLELSKKLTQNITDWESTKGETLTCEFCGTKWSKIYYPLHVQWKHSDRNVERCRIILCNFFENVMSVNDFSSVEMYRNSEVSVTVGEKSGRIIDTTTCEHCGKVVEKKKLAGHHNKCIKNYDVPVITAVKSGKSSNSNACQYCGKVFERKKLSKHRSKCIKNPNRKIFYHCECGYRSQEMAVIKEHRRTCKRDPVICDVCGKKLKSKSHYFKHRKFDHGIVSARGTAIKNYQCADCDRAFNLPSKLRVHRIRRHSDEKNYICEFCSSAYKFPTALKNHIQFAHNNIYRYYCEKCGHGMNKKSLVKTHVCGRTRKRLKLHEKWMKNLDGNDHFRQGKPTKPKTVKEHENKANVVHEQNKGKDCAANHRLSESSEQYFAASSELQTNYGSPSSLDLTHHKFDNIETTSQTNLRQPVNQPESMIFPMHSSYINLQPTALPGYQYPPFINSNETLPPSSGYDMNNYHMR